MYAVGRLSSYISQGVYTVSAPFHPFGGAVDIIVVQQQDGSFKSSPWYVKFGKFQGVLKTKEKVVSINVNGVDMDFHMYLEHTGEAYFLKEVDIEECESSVFDPSSSGEETDDQSRNKSIEKAKGQDFDVKQLSLNAQIDGGNGKIITRTNSRRSRIFGLFGRKSMKKDTRQREVVDDPVKRITSLERAEIAADLLEVNWSTSLTTKGPTMDEVSRLSSINVSSKEVEMNLHVNESTLVDSILLHDRINGSFANSSLQKATAPSDVGMGKICGLKLVDTEQSNGINSLKASCTSSENLDKEVSTVEASDSEEKFEVMPETSISKFDGDASMQCNAQHESDGNVQFLSAGVLSDESGTLYIFSGASKSSRVGFDDSDEQNRISGNSSNGESKKPLVHDKVPIDKVEARPEQVALMAKEDSSDLRSLNDKHSSNSSCTKAICGSEGSSFGRETRSIVTKSHCLYDIHLLTSASGGAEMLDIIEQETITETLTKERTSETNSSEVLENESQVMGHSRCKPGVSHKELEESVRSSEPLELVNGNQMLHSVEEVELQCNGKSGGSQEELEESARSSRPHLEVVSGNQMLNSVEEAESQGNSTSGGHQEEIEVSARSSGPHLGVVSGNQILHLVEDAELQGDCTSGSCQKELEESARSSGPHLEVVSGNQILHSVEEAELQGDCTSGRSKVELQDSFRSPGPHLEVVIDNRILHSVEEAELQGDCTSGGSQEELEESARSSAPQLEAVSGNRILHSVEEAEIQGDGTSGGSQEELEELSSGPQLEVVSSNRILHPVEEAELQGNCMPGGSQEELQESLRSPGPHFGVVSGNRILHSVEKAELQGDCTSVSSQEELEESTRSSGALPEVIRSNQILHSVKEAKLQADCTSSSNYCTSSSNYCTSSSNCNTTSLLEEEKIFGQETEMNKLHQSSALVDDPQLLSTEHSPTKTTPSQIPSPKISGEDQFTFSDDTNNFEPGAVHRADSGSDCVDTEKYPLVTMGSIEESQGSNDVNLGLYFSSVNNVQEPSISASESPIEESRTTFLSSPISIPRSQKCEGAKVDWMTKSVPNFRFHNDDFEISGIRHHLSHSLDSNSENFMFEFQKNGVSGSLTCDPNTEQQPIEDLTNDDIRTWEELKNMSTDSAVEISLCKHMLFEGMGADAASLSFEAEKVGLEKFVSLGPGILKNDKLIVKIGGQYFPWDAAAPIILGTLACGHDQKLVPRGMIPVERVEKTVNGEQTTATASSSGSWRIWPFTFKRSGTLNSAQPAQDSMNDFTSVSTSESISPVKDNSTGNVTENSTSNVTEKNTERKVTRKKLKSLVPSSEQLATLNLKEGQNVITFSFSTAMLGKQQVDAKIYLWKWNTHIVISDVDGTITKSDVLGQFMPLVGKDWSQTGVAHLFSAIKENGYQLLFLSARSISQAYLTRQFLFNLKQDGKALPDGPVVISPDGLFPSLFREVIRRAPHEFKIACLKDIKDLFPPDCNPFYAGFGNRDTDEFSYLKVGIPRGKIFIINAKGEVSVNHRVDRKSYTSLHALVNGMFPAMSSAAAEQEEFNSWNYWKMPLVDISSR